MKNKDSDSLEDLVDGTGMDGFPDPKDNCKYITADDYVFRASPVFAGQSTELIVSEMCGRKEENKIKKIILYEDDKKIVSKNGNILRADVVKVEEENHKYSAEIFKKSGRMIKTNPIDVKFTGHKIDFEPYINNFFASKKNAGKSINILVEARDIGDNRGIARIVLYEDGVLIDTNTRSSNLVRNIVHNSPGSHIYRADIEDLGGHIVRTKNLEIDYTGEAFPPKVLWFFANPQNAGRSTNIVIDSEDPDNYDNLKGVARIDLYEDGELIHKQRGSSLVYEVMHSLPGIHKFHAVVYNKNNKALRTDPFDVEFTGKDFPPEIDWWILDYKKEEGIATALVEANDKKNVRKDSGIRKIVLFEDRAPFRTVQGNRLLEKLKDRSGVHSYYAEITNKSGIRIRTEMQEINYDK